MFSPSRCITSSSFLRGAVTALAIGVSATACTNGPRGADAAHAGPTVVDDFGDTLRLTRPAARIVSLNPVVTEALYALGAGDRLVGRTQWDGAPPQVKAVANVGNGMQPNVEAVLAVRPDLVVLYASEANRAAASALRRAGVATLTVRTDRVTDFARVLRAIGVALGDTVAATQVADSVMRSIDAVRALPRYETPVTVFWHAWDAPVITIGAGSFQHELVVAAGATNIFGDLPDPSPQVTMESIARRNPDFVLAGPKSSVEMRRDPRWQSVAAVRAGRVLVVDTAVIGRPGVTMGTAARSLRALLDSALRATPSRERR